MTLLSLNKDYRESVLVNGNLFNQVSTLNPDFLVCDQMLNDHISHVLSEGVSLFV